MIRLFPSVAETLVLPMDSVEVTNRVRLAIINRSLRGTIDGNTFSIAPQQLRPHPFAPIVKGVIESSSRGCVVFLQYQLLPSVRATLWFWFFIVMGGSSLAVYQFGNWWFLGVGLLMSIFARWIALSNQRLHIVAVRKGLMSNLLDN